MAQFLSQVKACLTKLKELCHSEARASVWTFNHNVRCVVEDTLMKDIDFDSIANANGSTNFEEVLKLLESLSDNGPQDVILLSDGMPTAGNITSVQKQSFQNLFQVFDPIAHKLNRARIQIHTLAQQTSGSMPVEFLSYISNSTGGIHHSIQSSSGLLDQVFLDILQQQDAFYGVVTRITLDGQNILLELPVNSTLGLHKSLRKKEKVSWLVSVTDTTGPLKVFFADGSAMTLSVTEKVQDPTEVRLHELRVEGLRLLDRCQVHASQNHPLKDYFADFVFQIQKEPSQSDSDGILRRIEKLISMQVPHPDQEFESHLTLQDTQVLHHGLSAQRDSIGIASPWRSNSMRHAQTVTHAQTADPNSCV